MPSRRRSMWYFRFASAWILFGNAIGCAFLLGTASLYAYILSEPVVSFTVAQLEATILEYFTPMIQICYVAVAGHTLLAIRTVRHFLRRCLLAKSVGAVHPSRRRSTVATKLGPTKSSISLARPPTATSDQIQLNPIVFRIRARVRTYANRLRRLWTRYGPEITRVFILWEVANQTYQANKISQLIASVWINRLVALVIVVNCWFSPVLHFAMRGRRKLHTRLARLLLDSCLDFVYNIGIPLVIFYPYYHDYSDSSTVFPLVLYYMDTWYVSALSELRQVFVTSWVDLVSKITGSLALLHRLYVLENVLRDAQDPRVVSRRDTTTGRRPLPAAATAARLTVRRWRSRVAKCLDTVLLLWGMAVLSLHVHSTIVAVRGDETGCLLEIRPWGASAYSCSVLEISCLERAVTGQHPAIIDALDNVDPMELQVLMVSHCEQLEVPTIIQDYGALLMIKVYNTTIASWDETAALRDETHPELQVLYFARVKMSEIPAGLIARDFPANVWDIEFCTTNLTSFPMAIVEAWKNVVYVVVEANSLIVEAPEAILRLPSMRFLQLGMNQIKSLPPWAFENRTFANLHLDGNPLDELPARIKSIKELHKFGIRDTNIATLPDSWIVAKPPLMGRRVDVEADGSPLCGAETGKDRVIGPFAIRCTSGLVPMITYPLAEEDAWRAARASMVE